MSSRQGHGYRLVGRFGTRSAVGIARRLAVRLVLVVLAAAAAVAALEVVALQTGLLERTAGRGRWPLVDLLALGAVLVGPLVLLFGGWRLVRGHAEALRDLAVDDLTGTWSRRAFGEDLPEAVLASSSAGRPLTLALVEVTGVSAAADLLGRRRAEALVRRAATTLIGDGSAPPRAPSERPANRPPDRPSVGRSVGSSVAPADDRQVTYRLSGDVFAVVLPGLGPDAAFDLVDGLLESVARAAAPLSAVAGLCTLDVRCPDAQLLLLGASAALDEARALGPGRAVASADEESGLRWLATPGTATPSSPSA